MRPILFALPLAAGFMITAQAHEVIHAGHTHQHGAECGHAAIAHGGHVDYLHDGHLHNAHSAHADEHVLPVSAVNPVDEALVTKVEHAGHSHGAADDTHMMVQHGDHFDHVHDGRLHYTHGDHVDDHGPVTLITKAS